MNRRTEKDSGLRGSTGVDVCFVFHFFWLLMNNAAFWG